jgi:hypothetical protein
MSFKLKLKLLCKHVDHDHSINASTHLPEGQALRVVGINGFAPVCKAE